MSNHIRTGFITVKDVESKRRRLLNISHIVSVTDSYNGDCFIRSSDGTIFKTVETFEQVIELLGAT